MHKHKQSGAVLITTLFVTALAALIASTIAFRQHLFFSSSAGINQWQQAYQNWQLINSDAINQLLQQSQAKAIGYFAPVTKTLQVNDQTFSLSIIDAQSRYNLNLLKEQGQQAVLSRLLQKMNPKISAQQADRFSQQVKNWVSAGQSTLDDSYYLQRTPAYYASHADLHQLSEVTLVRGFKDLQIDWHDWRQYTIALPSSNDPINVNRYNASPLLLSALYPQIGLGQLQAYHQCLASNELPSRCDSQYLSSPKPGATVGQTSYFIVQASLRRPSQPPLFFSSLVHIQVLTGKPQARVIWQRFSED